MTATLEIITGNTTQIEIPLNENFRQLWVLLSEGIATNDLNAPVTIALTGLSVTAANSDSSFTTTGDAFADIVAGMWVTMAGFSSNDENNGKFLVTSKVSDNKIICSSPSEGEIQDESGSGISVTAPSEGDTYIVGSSPSGAWDGYQGYVADYQNGAWSFYELQVGNQIYCHADGAYLDCSKDGSGNYQWS